MSQSTIDRITNEVVTETIGPLGSVALKVFEAATGKSLPVLLAGVIKRAVRRLQLADLDIRLAPGAVVAPEVINRDMEPDPGAAPDERPL